jgi:hypothetical protein
MTWIAFDLVSILQGMFWGKDFILKFFRKNMPTDPEKLEEYTNIVDNLELLWNVLIWIAIAACVFLGWIVFSFWINKGKKDWPTARIVRKIPLIGSYLTDLGLAETFKAVALMLSAKVRIADALKLASNSTTIPQVAKFWHDSLDDLSRGITLGMALNRPPLTQAERMELANISDIGHVATVMDSIGDMRATSGKGKSHTIVMVAFLLSGVYLAIAFGSSIYALTIMNMGMDAIMGDVMGDMGLGGI